MNERASTGANNAAGACGKTCEPLDEIMIPSLVLKVNVPAVAIPDMTHWLFSSWDLIVGENRR